MSKTSTVVAMSRQRVPQSRTEDRKRPTATWVQTVRRHGNVCVGSFSVKTAKV